MQINLSDYVKEKTGRLLKEYRPIMHLDKTLGHKTALSISYDEARAIGLSEESAKREFRKAYNNSLSRWKTICTGDNDKVTLRVIFTEYAVGDSRIMLVLNEHLTEFDIDWIIAYCECFYWYE